MKKPSSIPVFVLSNRNEVRSYVRSSLESDPDLWVVSEAASARKALALIRQNRPRVLVIDWKLPNESEIAALLRRHGSLKAIVLVPKINPEGVSSIVEMGAHGLAMENVQPDELRHILHRLAEEGHYFDAEAIRIMTGLIRHEVRPEITEARSLVHTLTERELQIITRITSGQTNRTLSREFAISERTVRHHLTSIYSKLGVNGRVSLAMFALDHKLGENL